MFSCLDSAPSLLLRLEIEIGCCEMDVEERLSSLVLAKFLEETCLRR